MNIRSAITLVCAALVIVAGPVEASDEEARLEAFFEEVFQRDLARSPIRQSRMGIRDRQHEWDDISDTARQGAIADLLGDLEQLAGFDLTALSPEARESVRLFEWAAHERLARHEWRYHDYILSQMAGMHTRVGIALMNTHPVRSREDAEAYIARLRAVPALFESLIDELRAQEAAGVRPPQFVYGHVMDAARNLITGQPFSDDGDSPLWGDFTGKLDSAQLSDADRDTLRIAARQALLEDFGPAYERLLDYLADARTRAPGQGGVWRLPDGEAYYQAQLERFTTLPGLTAQEIHAYGLAEVARIHDEMRQIMDGTGFGGDLAEFFVFMRESPDFYFEDSEEGREAYLARARAMLEEIRGRQDELFSLQPGVDVVIEAVEPWRERTAAKAFYQSPPRDGSRPGVFYINLYDMGAAPLYQLPALLYHEAIPGHHVETVVAYELEALPLFRRYLSISAFSEGWGLYSERLAREIGLYQDPYDDFGRLSMEVLRAARLVVDTGIHAFGWSREEAIAYMDEVVPASHYDNLREVERYIVYPGQAVSYAIGMMKILELRATAREALGDAFDLRQFHDVVLGSGPVPLAMLEDNVMAWVEACLSGEPACGDEGEAP
jgi:uncharacterized protein (DUF885 family)